MTAPIVVTGSHRSGTTWTGRMLSLSDEAGYIHEPFNPRRRPGWTGNRIPYWYLYVCAENEEHYEPVVRDVLAFRYPVVANLLDVRGVKQLGLMGVDLQRSIRFRLSPRRPLLKDPFVLFSAAWLEHRFGAHIVVMVRHPAAFVSSIVKLNWRFGFRSWLAQPLLMRDWLAPFEDEMRRHSAEDADIIDQGILMWNVIHYVIDKYRDLHPSWSFVRHEDLAAAPAEGFHGLYGDLGLTWSDDVRRQLDSFTTESNPKEVRAGRHQSVRRDSRAAAHTWRTRLSRHEIDRVRVGVQDISKLFYADDEWL